MVKEKSLDRRTELELQKLCKSQFNGLLENNKLLYKLVREIKGYGNNCYVFLTYVQGVLSVFSATQLYKSPKLVLTYDSGSNKCILA